MIMRYRDRSEMKDSGGEWLGEIPEEWGTCRVKHLADLQTGNSITASDKDEKYSEELPDFYPYIGTKDVDIDTCKIKYDNGLYIPKKNNFIIAAKRTTLICVEGGSAGKKIGYLEYDVCYGNKLCNVKHNQKTDSKIIYYLLQSKYFVEQFFLNTTGIIPGISTDDFRNIEVSLPSKLEQQKIANFLDLKTAQFDAIISKKEQLVKKLEEAKKSLISEVVTGKVKIVDGKLVERKPAEMKDSGVEWLGMIPGEWEVKKIKHIARVRDKKSKHNNNSRYIGLENIESKTGRYIENEDDIFIEGTCNTFKENDVLFGKLRPYLAKGSRKNYFILQGVTLSQHDRC